MTDLLRALQIPIIWVSLVLTVVPLAVGIVFAMLNPKLVVLMFKNLRRNILRTSLTAVAIVFFVLVVTMIGSVISFLDETMRERSQDLKVIVTERLQIPSQLPLTHANYLDPDNSAFLEELRQQGIKPGDFMTWSFYGGTLDGENDTRENQIFFFVMNPDHIKPMMEDLEDLDDELVEKLKNTRNGCLVGPDRLKVLDREVGERFKVQSFNYKGIDLDFEIVGKLPDGRYNRSAIMNQNYFYSAFEAYERENGTPHPKDSLKLNLIWLRVKDRDTFNRVADIVQNASEFADRPVKCETASSGVSAFLEPYADLIWAMKWGLIPAILISMSLVVANSISISVRERRTEMAVMKVLGYRPGQIMFLVLGEALFVGMLSGLFAATITYVLINIVAGGIRFPIAFFPAFLVPWQAFLWGGAMGFVSSFVGSFLPSLSARSVKVSEVFSKVA